MCSERRNMSAVQLLRVSVHARISAAAEDFLLQVEKGGGKTQVPALREILTERLRAAAEEILAGLEETLAEYEDRVEQSEREICRQRRLLDAVMQPVVRLHRAVCPADVQQMIVIKEEVPPKQQQWSPLVDKEDEEPPHIKEEQEEPWTNQDGQQLQGLEEADIKVTWTPVTVKSEEDEEKIKSSKLHPSETKDNRADCGGPEPARNSGPDGRLQRVCPADVQEPMVNKEEVPPKQQQWSPLVAKEDLEPPHIKEEQEEPWTNQDGQQLQGLEEADIKFTLTPVTVNSEEDEKKLRLSNLHPSETKENRPDCGGPEPARNSGPDGCLQQGTEDKTEDSSETEDSEDDWMETREPQTGLNTRNKKQPLSDMGRKTEEVSFSCSECGKRFNYRGHLNRHMRIHTGETPFSCSECGKRFNYRGHLNRHMRSHTGEKPFSCPVCSKRCIHRGHLNRHMRIHTGEKPFSCSECGQRFVRRDHLNTHMMIHTGEKPCSCSECGKRFRHKGDLNRHIKSHTAEKQFS
ncbi:zinc finger and SCAN domain-containing protein 21-like [Platichthys flesus]|uniref:zinc finger and SCAN domain-containing protein 21-like n=1 Tax=Platichthys flesus TaxID=8260 RepID=UPI002DB789F7|nr:zinc finger and SCAN domain-containing protein 21-like [Platichthys flesus]